MISRLQKVAEGPAGARGGHKGRDCGLGGPRVSSWPGRNKMMGGKKRTADAEAPALKCVPSAGSAGPGGQPTRRCGRGRAPVMSTPRVEFDFGHSLRGGRPGSVLRPLCLVFVVSFMVPKMVSQDTKHGVWCPSAPTRRVRGHRGLICGLRVAGGRDGICFCLGEWLDSHQLLVSAGCGLGWSPGGMVWGMARAGGQGFLA